MRKICFFISLFLVFALMPFGVNVYASGNNELSSSASFVIPPKNELSDKFLRNEFFFKLHVDEALYNLIRSKQIRYEINGHGSNFPELILNHDYEIGYSFSINASKTYWGYYLYTHDLTNDTSAEHTLHTGSVDSSDFIGFDSNANINFKISTTADYDLTQTIGKINISNKDIQNFNFTGFKMLSDDVLINAYGFDCTVYFNIPCDYGGLDGVALGKNSIIEDKILNTLKKSSVFKFNGKKLNIPTNKLSIHFYEPTTYSSDELKKQYGYYTLSDKNPYDLWKNGDGCLRGTIIFTTGNVPQVDGNIPIEYKADFVDSCYSKYFSFKGYDFSSTTYSCTGSVHFQSVVDADNDGFDDNTGKGVGTPYDDNGNHSVAGETVEDEPNRSDYDDGILGLVEYIGDLIVYWIKAPFVSIANGFTILINSANSCFDWFGNFGDFFNNFFSFLPSPIQSCAIAIISATTVSIILAMFFKR